MKDINGNWVSNGGAWDSSFENYNCYGYVFGNTDLFYKPGDIAFDYGSIEEFYVGGMYEDDIAKICSIRAF